MTAEAATPAIAFFDVDGTLTRDPTLFSFLRFYLAAAGHPPEEYDARRGRLAAMTVLGVPRATTNRAYFENWAGADVGVVAELARQWCAAEAARGGFWNAHVVRLLRRHQAQGVRTVLVSGSFRACLEPLAAELGVDLLACARPDVEDGRYTGRLVDAPMIGAVKARAVTRIAARTGVPPGRCVSVGDHSSDLEMLLATGTAVVVGDDDILLAHAAAAGWARLPGPAQPS